MDHEYELFERDRDGVLNWRGVVVGLSAAQVRARLLALETDNECFAVRSDDQEVVARAAPAEAA